MRAPLLAALLAGVLAQVANDAASSPRLVAHYPLDAGAANAAASTPRSLHGTVAGGVRFSRAHGFAGGNAVFSPNASINCGGLDVDGATYGDVTFGGWFSVAAGLPLSHTGSQPRLWGLMTAGGSPGLGRGLVLQRTAAGLRVGAVIAGTGSDDPIVRGGPVQPRQWHFAAVAYTVGAVTLWVNEELAIVTPGAAPTLPAPSSLTLGGGGYEGAIDEAFVYKGVLTDAQVARVRRASLGANRAPSLPPTAGRSGYALSFQGSCRHFVRGTLPRRDGPLRALSAALWLRPATITAAASSLRDADGAPVTVLAVGGRTTQQWAVQLKWQASANTYTLTVSALLGDGLVPRVWTPTATLRVDVWTHVAMSWDVSGAGRLWIDGALVSVDDLPAGEFRLTEDGETATLTVGAGWAVIDDPSAPIPRSYSGEVDGVRLWASALTTADAQAAYGGQALPQDDMAGSVRWEFDEPSGRLALDAVQRGYAGVSGTLSSGWLADGVATWGSVLSDAWTAEGDAPPFCLLTQGWPGPARVVSTAAMPLSAVVVVEGDSVLLQLPGGREWGTRCGAWFSTHYPLAAPSLLVMLAGYGVPL